MSQSSVQLDANNSPEGLISAKELIRKLQNSGIKFGKADPFRRIRYYVKLGLIPRPIRKLDPTQTYDKSKPPPTAIYYPVSTVEKITEVERNKKTGITVSKQGESEVRKEPEGLEFPAVGSIPATPIAQAAPVIQPSIEVESEIPSPQPLFSEEPYRNSFARSITRFAFALLLIISTPALVVGSLYLLNAAAPNETTKIATNKISGVFGKSLQVAFGTKDGGSLTKAPKTFLGKAGEVLARTTAPYLKINVETEIADLLNALGGIETAGEDVDLGTGDLTAANVIYGISGGDNVAVSAGQTPTISVPSLVGSVSGTSGRITSTEGANPVINIASTYSGQTSITTLGTVATGTWNGTSISDAFVDNDLTISGSGSVTWTALTSYPTSCLATEFVRAVGDILTCATDSVGVASLQEAYDGGNTITTTDARDIIFTLADTATDSDFIVDLLGTGNIFDVRDGGTPVFTIADTGTLTTTGQFTLGDDSNTGYINTSDWDISTTGDMTNIGSITADGTLTVSGAVTHDIAGTLNLSGDTLTSSGDLAITPTGGDVNITGNLDVSSHLAVGGAASVVAWALANINETISTAGARGLYLVPTFNPAAGTVIQSFTNDPTFNPTGGLSTFYGTFSDFTIGGSATVASATQLWIDTPTIGGSTVIDLYGIHIEDQTGATNNYSIYQTGTSGVNILNADTRIGSTTAPTVALDVTGNIALSGILDVNGGDGSDFAGSVTFNDDVDFVFGGAAENFFINADNTLDGFNIFEIDADIITFDNNVEDHVLAINFYDASGSAFFNDASDSAIDIVFQEEPTFDIVDADYQTGLRIFVEGPDGDTAGVNLANGILIDSEGNQGIITDAIDVSDSDITNALNIGTNTILSSGSFTIDLVNAADATLTIDNTGAGDANLSITGNLSVLGADGTDDDFIYFDTGTSESISWNNFWGTFFFTDTIWLSSGGFIGSFNTANDERLCWDADGTSFITDCSGTPGDYAEYYGTTDVTLEAGDLVAVDPTRPAQEVEKENVRTEITEVDGESVKMKVIDIEKGSKAWVIKTSYPYQQGLIGIVSTQPNEVIGENFEPEENPRPISLNGRVPVKVSAENGPIAPGDPLTSSPTPGVAMSACARGYGGSSEASGEGGKAYQCKSGPIVGKALESFECQVSSVKCQGKIIVFVSVGWYVEPIVTSNTPQVAGLDNLSLNSLTANFIVLGNNQISLDQSGNIRVDGDLMIAGDVTLTGEIAASSISTDELSISGKTSGFGSIQPGRTSVTINNNKVNPDSKVIITFNSNWSPATRYWVEKQNGKFIAKLDKPASSKVNFDWWVIN